MERRLFQIRELDAPQQLQSVVPVQPVERNQLRRRFWHIAEISRPIVLVDRRDHRLFICQHLAYAMGIEDLDVCKMSQNLKNAPLVWRRFVTKSLIRQS